jgi:hypothetical protein
MQVIVPRPRIIVNLKYELARFQEFRLRVVSAAVDYQQPIMANGIFSH